MNVLVTGGSGQLGSVLKDAARNSGHRFIYTYFSSEGHDDMIRLDITDRDAVGRIVREHDIDVIVNCAGYTDVEKAESEEDKAFKVNAEAVGVLAEAAKAAGPYFCMKRNISEFGSPLVEVEVQEAD